MSYRFSLAYLTVMDATPPEAVQIAAACGYDHVGLRLLPAGNESPFPLLSDARLLRETRAVLQDTGVTVADIEIVRIGAQFDPQRYLPLLERGAELGARHVLVAGDDDNLDRCAGHFARFCELAVQYRLTADLEPMPWTGVKNVRDALQVIETAGSGNGYILIDALHFDRSDSTLEQVAAIAPGRINYVQFCDAPHIDNPTLEQLIFTARDERMLPGAGEIDLKGLLQAIPADTVLSIEVPRKAEARHLSAQQRAQQGLEALKRLIG
ncbi:MAG: sugar phosphate isomerase/epimerase [Thiothrix sp.]|nr:sugar phosphate isomerase/epimerase [Thiothrix sp.]HPQ94872.1 sugar phosphate isomerase/epimerase [Thiolinea sp.]